jgi:hypothetical protein
MEIKMQFPKLVAALVALIALASPRLLTAAEKPTQVSGNVQRCRVVPSSQRSLKMNFKPDSALLDVVKFYATAVCKRVDAAGDLSKQKITVSPKGLISPEELAQLIRSAAEAAHVGYEEDELAIQLRSP